MELILWILAVVLVISGIVVLVRGEVLWESCSSWSASWSARAYEPVRLSQPNDAATAMMPALTTKHGHDQRPDEAQVTS